MILTAVIALAGARCLAAAPEAPVFDTEVGELRIATLAAVLQHPWTLACLPGGRWSADNPFRHQPCALAGRNHGGPVITYGLAYSGATKVEGHRKAGLEQPLWCWPPSIASSGMAFYKTRRIPPWTGNLFVGALCGTLVSRRVLDGDRIIQKERRFEGLKARIRDVRQSSDGLLYVLEDSPAGRLLQVEPIFKPAVVLAESGVP